MMISHFPLTVICSGNKCTAYECWLNGAVVVNLLVIVNVVVVVIVVLVMVVVCGDDGGGIGDCCGKIGSSDFVKMLF